MIQSTNQVLSRRIRFSRERAPHGVLRNAAALCRLKGGSRGLWHRGLQGKHGWIGWKLGGCGVRGGAGVYASGGEVFLNLQIKRSDQVLDAARGAGGW